VIEDLITVGAGLDIVERPVADDEIGPLEQLRSRNPVVAVVRGGEVLRFDDARAAGLQPGDFRGRDRQQKVGSATVYFRGTLR
jgi:voltage-gated potassium channel